MFFFQNFDPKLAFWPQISTQKPKFGQKYFFRDPEAPRFPTRGHMPMFEKIRFFGPETGPRARILENRNFRDKSPFVSFLQFWSSNFVPKIMKILRAVFQKNRDLCHFWAVLGYFGPFWDRWARFFENRNFSGKTVRHDSCHNSKEPWCKK